MLQKEFRVKMKDYWEIVGQARWIYIVTIVAIGIVTNFSGIISFGLPSWVLWIIAWAAILYNFLPAYILKRREKIPGENLVTIISFVQFALDLLIISALVHFGGGVESLAFIFYFVVIAASSFMYRREGVYSITFLALFLYNVVIYGNYLGYFFRFSRAILADRNVYERTGLIVIDTFVVSAAIISTGFFIGYLSYLRNKKEEEAWNEKIRRLEEVKKTEEIRSKFVTVLTHQFRSPLYHIKLALSDLLEKKDSLPEENVKWLLEGWAAMERLIVLVDRLVKMKEIEEQKFVVHKDVICLDDVIRGCVKSLEYSALIRN
jgi:signal transduction histidine kinase